MADWPTGDDVREWMGDEQVRDSTVTDQILDDVAAAATEALLELIEPTALPAPVPPAIVGSCPPAIRLAIRILASKLWIRKDSPGGVIAFQEFAIRVNQFDPDVDRLIAKYRRALVG